MTRIPLPFALFLLTACASSPQPSTVPIPPRVECQERSPAETLPPMFANLDEAQVWAAQVSGIYERANLKRATTANCLDAMRVAGTIR